MHPVRQLLRQRGVDQAVAFEPGLAGKGFRHDIDPEVSLAAFTPAAMALMLV